jgi:enoyl-CoA hydratase
MRKNWREEGPMTDGVIVNKTDELLEITLNSPDRGNGMTDDQIVFLGDLLEREHDKVRLITLRANGADFCMGRAHLGPRPTALPEALQLRRMHDIVFRVYGAVRHSKAPVISVVKGRAYGFGCALASVCDITIADENATTSCRPW